MTSGEAQENDKICPLISRRGGRPWQKLWCQKDECAWWIEPSETDRARGVSGECAVRRIAKQLEASD
jgi:hypothetical protein